MEFKITILGANSAIPVHGRYPSSQFVQIHNYYFLIDCGEGTQMRLRDLKVKWAKIDHIFISHLHGDHFFGLPGLLSTLSLLGREKAMTIIGPLGIKNVLTHLFEGCGIQLKYNLEFIETNTSKSEVILENDAFRVINIPLNHRGPTNGYRFDTLPQPLNIRSEKIQEYDLSIEQIKSAKAGEQLTVHGIEIPNGQLTHPPQPNKSYAYCSDTMYDESVLPIIRDVTLLYHESTYLHEKLELAEWSKHTTALQAGQMATKANAGQLIIGHYSSRYPDIEPLLLEAKKSFANSDFAEHGKVFEI